MDIREFEWDSGNSFKNFIKHGVEIQECEQIFFNKPLRIFKDIKHSEKETRYIALGISDVGRFLFIAFTIRDSKIRVISARNQSAKERNYFLQNRIEKRSK